MTQLQFNILFTFNYVSKIYKKTDHLLKLKQKKKTNKNHQFFNLIYNLYNGIVTNRCD